MAKNRNLKYQFKNVIDRHFVEGMDKHSISIRLIPKKRKSR